MTRSKCRESVTTHVLPNGQGPAVQNVRLSVADQSVLELEAWIGNFGGSNVWIFTGRIDLAAAQNMVGLTAPGKVDGYPVTGAGYSRFSVNSDVKELTIFYEGNNASGQSQAVCISVKEYTA